MERLTITVGLSCILLALAASMDAQSREGAKTVAASTEFAAVRTGLNDTVFFAGFLAVSPQFGFGAALPDASTVLSSLKDPGPRYRVTGRVHPDANATAGNPVEGFPSPAPAVRGNVVEVAGKTEAGSELKVRVVLDSNGAFEFPTVPRGAYRVAVLPKTSLDPIDIRVIDRDVDVHFGVRPVTVSATVSVEDGRPTPPFRLRFNDPVGVMRSHVRVAGTFVAEIFPGAYRLVADLPPGFSVASIRRPGVDIVAQDLNLTASGPVEIAITLRAATPSPWIRIQGRVVRDGNGPTVSAVVLSGDNISVPLKADVMGASPPSPRNEDTVSVAMVNWEEVREFIARLNALDDGHRYRLPTEAEWEYAARAGDIGPDPDAADSEAFGWFRENGGSLVRPVGEKSPNAWGLYDMRGNVAEWVSDWYDIGYYETSPAMDPVGPVSGAGHVYRGGSVQLPADRSRVSSRAGWEFPSAGTGFRLVLERRR